MGFLIEGGVVYYCFAIFIFKNCVNALIIKHVCMVLVVHALCEMIAIAHMTEANEGGQLLGNFGGPI